MTQTKRGCPWGRCFCHRHFVMCAELNLMFVWPIIDRVEAFPTAAGFGRPTDTVNNF